MPIAFELPPSHVHTSSGTRENIENAMLLLRKARPEDTVALFLAGHGAHDGPNYVFLAQDTSAEGGHFLPSTVVRWHVFQDALHTANGRCLMFVDTCHAGGALDGVETFERRDQAITMPTMWLNFLLFFENVAAPCLLAAVNA